MTNRLRQVREDVLREHTALYLGPVCTPHGMGLFTALTRHPSCKHVRWVIDWEAQKICTVCEGQYALARADALIAEYEARIGHNGRMAE